ncbi:MAG: hypothetical protein JO258_01305 [Alphaproteobacteria bacterium]|nr:hypothetical protein [Alphaproteobacteria bacterium]
MLDGWHEFYALLGTGAASMVALLFVAVSIGAGFLSRNNTGPTRTFMSPVIFHYTCILLVSLIALIPTHTAISLAGAVGAVGAVGFVYTIVVLVRVIRDPIGDLADSLAYGAGPLAAYAGTVFAARLLAHYASGGPTVLAIAMLLLLVVNIRNAWDLALSLARRATEQRAKEAGAPPRITLPPSP